MRRYITYLTVILIFYCCQACSNADSVVAVDEEEVPRILVFFKTSGYYHESIPVGIAAIQKLGQEHKVLVDTTGNASYFNLDSLDKYAAVVFLSTTGNVLDEAQQEAFEKYIQAGGGFVGVHSATDTEYEWPWYNKLVGAYFANHPQIQMASIDVVDKNHPATKDLPTRWEHTDEWYNFKNMNTNVQVLANLDEQTYEGGTHGSDHPIAWYHAYDGGRSFYTALGHTSESYKEPLFLKHLWGGIVYAIKPE